MACAGNAIARRRREPPKNRRRAVAAARTPPSSRPRRNGGAGDGQRSRKSNAARISRRQERKKIAGVAFSTWAAASTRFATARRHPSLSHKKFNVVKPSQRPVWVALVDRFISRPAVLWLVSVYAAFALGPFLHPTP